MRIVCFHLNQVGDLAFSLPALKCVRDSFPDAVITSVVRPGAVEVAAAVGIADEVIARPVGAGPAKFRLVSTLASRKYDLAVVLSQSAECALLSYFSRAPKRIGFVDTSLGWLLTRRVDFKHPPSTENNLRLVEAAGCDVMTRDYVGLLRPTPEQTERAGRLMSACGIGTDDPFVVLAPGTSRRRGVKEWTDVGFAAVGRHIAGGGTKVVILGTMPAAGITGLCPEITDLSGKTTLGEVVAILAASRALVGVDSGILHLAAAVGTRVVGLYGPSDPAITGPQGRGHIVLRSGACCSPCIKTRCSFGRKCMTDLLPGQVIAAVEDILRVEA